VKEAVAPILLSLDEIICSLLRRHPGVHEADQVRQRVVAEDQIHAGIGVLIAMNGIEAACEFGTEAALPISGKLVPIVLPRTPSSVAIH